MPRPEREACERRVYRLASLLSGDPAGALRVVEAVIDLPAGPAALDDAHLDRLTVLRTRELVPDARPIEGPDHVLAARFARLPFQHREAWVLREVYGLDPRDAARAMDCSVTALERHLAAARSAIEQAAGEGEALSEALRRRSLELSPPALLRRRRRHWRRFRGILRWTVRLLFFAVVAAVLAGAAWYVLQLIADAAPEAS